MFEGTDSVLNTKSVISSLYVCMAIKHIIVSSFKHFLQIFQKLPVRNSYCDHRNFDMDSVNQP